LGDTVVLRGEAEFIPQGLKSFQGLFLATEGFRFRLPAFGFEVDLFDDAAEGLTYGKVTLGPRLGLSVPATVVDAPPEASERFVTPLGDHRFKGDFYIHPLDAAWYLDGVVSAVEKVAPPCFDP
jgi:hypothetical protein